MVRGDSMFGTKKVITTCVQQGVEFSLSVSRNKRISAAIEGIDEAAYTPVHYPGAVRPRHRPVDLRCRGRRNPLPPAAGPGRTLTVRLVVRRVKDARYPDALFPVWRHHPFVTNSELPTAEADITHRRHAIIETTFADLIDGPLAHVPSGLFAANCAWLGCAVIAHNLLRAAAPSSAVTTPWPAAPPCAAIWSTCRPASPPRPANRCCTYQPTGPGNTDGKRCGTTLSATQPHNPAPPDPTIESLSTPPPPARPEEPRNKEKLVQASRSRMCHRAAPGYSSRQPPQRPHEITHPRIQAKTCARANRRTRWRRRSAR